MITHLSDDQNDYLRRLKRMLNPKNMDGSLQVADGLGRHPEHFELLVSEHLNWPGSDTMELRGAWHQLLNVRPDMAVKFMKKLETIHPVWSDVITPETLFRPGVGSTVLAGMEDWGPEHGSKAIQQALRHMINIQLLRPLALDDDAWEIKAWISESMERIERLNGNAAKVAASELDSVLILQDARPEARERYEPVLRELIGVCADYINIQSMEDPKKDRVRHALEAEDVDLACVLVNAGARWQECWNDGSLGNYAKIHLIGCPVVWRTMLEERTQGREETEQITGRKHKL